MKWLYFIAYFAGLCGSILFAIIQNIYFELIALLVTAFNWSLLIKEELK